MKWTTCFHHVPRLRMVEARPLLPPVCLYGVQRNNMTFTITESMSVNRGIIKAEINIPATFIPLNESTCQWFKQLSAWSNT